MNRHASIGYPKEKARSLSQRIQLSLRKRALNDPSQRKTLNVLAKALDKCSRHNRCHSGACPVCTRREQVWFVERMNVFEREVDEPLSVLSIVLPLRLRPGCTTAHAKRQFGRMLAQLNRDLACLPWVVGGIDVSVNEHAGEVHKPCYQFQLWAFAPTRDLRRAEDRLRARFPAPRHVKRPVRVLPFDGDPRAFAYALKPNFDRRVTLPAITEKQARTLGVTPRRQNTKHRPLRSAQEADLRLILHALGIKARLVLMGVEVKDGALCLRPKLQLRLQLANVRA